MGKDRKIYYPFVALPRWICTSEYYHSPSMFIFLSWIFSRISFGRRSIPINNQMLDLDVGEFIFGRAACSAETGISEQSLRTLIRSLSLQEILQKVTPKSTNRFTVYKVFWSRLSENSNQQTNPQPTNNPPADNHNQEKEYKNIESKQGLLPHANEDEFNSLSTSEQNVILALFQKRSGKKAISNPSGWIRECIKNGWHKSKPPSLEPVLRDSEINRAVAQQVAEELRSAPAVIVQLRRDFIELGAPGRSCWQMFYHEDSEIFRKQLQSALQRLGYTEFNF